MLVDIVMPKMGESIMEGTILNGLKNQEIRLKEMNRFLKFLRIKLILKSLHRNRELLQNYFTKKMM